MKQGTNSFVLRQHLSKIWAWSWWNGKKFHNIKKLSCLWFKDHCAPEDQPPPSRLKMLLGTSILKATLLDAHKFFLWCCWSCLSKADHSFRISLSNSYCSFFHWIQVEKVSKISSKLLQIALVCLFSLIWNRGKWLATERNIKQIQERHLEEQTLKMSKSETFKRW